jgi:predicted RNase H-like HicB family nuclease
MRLKTEERGQLMQFQGLIEKWSGEYTVFFRELPGCLYTAATHEEVVKGAPDAIAAYLKWAKANDITVLEEFDGAIEVNVKEHLSTKEHTGLRFEADLAPPSDTEIDIALNVAAAARAALLELYEDLTPEQQQRVTAPGSWSFAQHLQHLRETEIWYVSQLTDQPLNLDDSIPLPADLAMAFFEDAMDHELLLRALTPEQCARLHP